MAKRTQKTLAQIRKQLEELKPALRTEFKVDSIEIFGSYTRGQQTRKSDVDILVTFSEPYGLWQFLDVKEFLTKKLHIKVDLVPKDSIKSLIRDQILEEAIPI